MAARFARDLGGFLRSPHTLATCHEYLKTNLADRQANFLKVLQRGVFGIPDSPYHKLVNNAGFAFADIHELVDRRGLEEALSVLYDAGVHISLEEFKGLRPIRRGSLEIPVDSHAFDNPIGSPHWMARSGGSRSGGRRIYFDLAHCAEDAFYDRLFLEAFDGLDRPFVLWRPPPPWYSGFTAVLSYAKLGIWAAKWFSQNRMSFGARQWKHSAVAAYTIAISRLYGPGLPLPDHVPLSQAGHVARWLASAKRRGRAALLHTNASSMVRVCRAAQDESVDISGTLIRSGGEPYTRGKAAVAEAAGCVVGHQYSMSETGRIGLACADPAALDDVHLLTPKFALIRKPPTGDPQAGVMINVLTTLTACTPKLMLNVETGDYGTLEARECGCLLGRLGLSSHLSSLRSWEKLTSEGVTFIGSHLIRLVEQVLPERFGGHATDYQFVEEEVDGLPKVRLNISPGVGFVDIGQVVGAIVDFLNTVPEASDDFAERWRQGDTLRVARQEPYATSSAKIQALHVVQEKRRRKA